LEIHTNWLGCTVTGNGSYNFNISESKLPVHVVTTLLSPSPKCNKWFKYLEDSSPKIDSSNCDVNADAILLIASSFGIVKSPALNVTVINSSLPTISLLPLLLYGTNFKFSLITSFGPV